MDYTNCDSETLFAVLEHIDVEAYPQNALSAYRKLVELEGLDNIRLRYSEEHWLFRLLKLPFWESYLDQPSTLEMQQKLKLISQLSIDD